MLCTSTHPPLRPPFPGPYLVNILNPRKLPSDPSPSSRLLLRHIPAPTRHFFALLQPGCLSADVTRDDKQTSITSVSSTAFLSHALLIPIGSRIHPSITHASSHTFPTSPLSLTIYPHLVNTAFLPPIGLMGANYPYILPAFLNPIGLYRRLPFLHPSDFMGTFPPYGFAYVGQITLLFSRPLPSLHPSDFMGAADHLTPIGLHGRCRSRKAACKDQVTGTVILQLFLYY